LKGNGEMRKS